MANIKEHASILVSVFRVLEVTLILISGIVSFKLLESNKHFPAYDILIPNNYINAIGVAILLSLWWFPKFNLYRSWRAIAFQEEIKSLVRAWITSMIGLIIFIFFTKTADQFSRHWLILWWMIALGLMVSVRYLLRIFLRKARSNRLNLRHIILVGSEEKCNQIADKINSKPWHGLNIVGYFCDQEHNARSSDLKYMGKTAAIVKLLKTQYIDQVWISLSVHDSVMLDELISSLAKTTVEVVLVPDFFGLKFVNYSVKRIEGLSLINLVSSPMEDMNTTIKWVEDKVLSLFIIVFIFPVMLLIAMTIKITSPGPVLYKQERISWNGKKFWMYKFRTMPENADHKFGEPVWGNALAKKPTRLGGFLRKTSLDELPQLINVLKGDMSIVGPRPERPVFVDQFRHEVDGYMQKHLVKAGITGWAQVNGWRGDSCIKTRIEHDLYYIEHWSLWFDLKIILLTISNGLINDNAY